MLKHSVNVKQLLKYQTIINASQLSFDWFETKKKHETFAEEDVGINWHFTQQYVKKSFEIPIYS